MANDIDNINNIHIVEAYPVGNGNLQLILSSSKWPEGTRQFTYKLNDNGTLTLIKTD